MPSINPKIISFVLSLLDENGSEVNDQKLTIQYFNVSQKQWIELISQSTSAGKLDLEIKTSSKSKSLLPYFDLLKSEVLPDLRVINPNAIFDFGKTEVIAIENKSKIDAEKEMLQFDFGVRQLLDKASIAKQKQAKDFVLVTKESNLKTEKEYIKIIDDQKKALDQKNTEVAKLTEAIDKQSNTVTQLSKDLETKANEVKSVQKKLEEKEQEFAGLTDEISLLKKEIKNSTKEIKANDSKIIKLSKELDDKDLTIKGNIENINDLKAQISESQNDVLEYKNIIEAGKKVKEEFDVKLELQNKTISDLTEQVKAITKERDQKDEEISNLKGLNLELEQDKIILKEKIEELSEEIDFDDKPIAVQSLFTNIVKEVDLAKTSNLTSNYSLANISLKLKTLVSSHEGGVNVQVLNKANASEINGNIISELQFDLQDNRPKNVAQIKTPDLKGHTETAVRKILSSLGLRLNEVYQNNINVTNGDAFKQSPNPETLINTNDLVTVIFSKNE